jgi:hypothetical protein
MSNVEYWDSHYRDGDFEHWEFNYPSPELVAIVAAGILRKNSRILDAGAVRTQFFLHDVGSE